MKYFVCLLTFFLSFNNLSAQGEQGFNEITFLTEDNVEISGLFRYPLKVENSRFPAVILIHQAGSSKQEWIESSIIDKLLKGGIAVLAYDIRLHGDSAKDGDISGLFNDPQRTPLDLLAAIEFLRQDTNIDSNRIGVLGASIGGNLACMAASSDKFKVKSVVSISAKTEAVQNLSGSDDRISPQNVFYIASEKEQDGKRVEWANELYSLTKEKRKIKIAPGNKHGSYILREHDTLYDEIVQWFGSTL